MKDRELREAVRLLNDRLGYLKDEFKLMKEPHVNGCKCKLCGKPRYNPFIRGNHILDE